jgi:HEAT repeat protein
LLFSLSSAPRLRSSLVADVSVNMRREGKLYSWEDQKWDAEMRREMESKRKRELLEEGGKERDIRALVKEAKLSQKQKENILSQLSLEETTRERLLHWDQLLSRVTSVAEEVGGARLIGAVGRVTRTVMEGMRSPLGGSYCQGVWVALAHGVVGDWVLAQRFAVISFSILSSSSSSSPLRDSVPRLLDELSVHLPPSPLHSHSLHTLSLPLLRSLLVENKMEAVLEKTVSVLCAAIDRYAEDVGVSMATGEDEAPPTSFPEAATLQLLSSLVSWEEDKARSVRVKKSCAEAYVSLIRFLPSLSPEILSLLTSDLSDPCTLLRQITLRSLAEVDSAHFSRHLPLQMALLVARHDSKEGNRTLAESLWKTTGYSLEKELGPLLLAQVPSAPLSMQPATAQALGLWLQSHPQQAPKLQGDLLAVYEEKRAPPPPKEDSFGRTVVVQISDPWECRVGVARALEQLPSHMTPQETMTLLEFTIPGALSDPNPNVLAAFMSAAKTAIGCHGDDLADQLMEHCEGCLQSAGDTRESDVIRQSVVVLMGTLARHLDKGNPKVKAVVNLLLSNLDTPSQSVQEAIAGCLPPLAHVVKPEAEKILTKLLEKLFESTSYSQRRGAAYGLAGLVKGLGIPSLKQHRVMPALQEAIKNKKNYRHREGALFAFECLCDTLGRLFEPYVVHLLPDLLLCFGDGNQYVREATDRTARTIMGQLSSHGVKLILPSLLTALEEDSWRTKAGSAELLGAMAFCAPKQLSSCLPSIVPRLMDVLADSHSKVQNAGNTALRQIGSVIKNPEIQALVPILLESLADPSVKAQVCLQSLLETEFVHVIDPPSLALIMPTLKKTLDLRSTESKKMAAQIIGNMYSLTDKKDLAPYLPEVLPGLKSSLVDPVPEVRRVCAKALGAMVQGMGDETLAELLPWLLQTLQSESSAVDRSGAAQGLSEVLLAQGYDRLAGLMPRFIESSQDPDNPTHVRDGYLMLFVYLPIAFGDEFIPFLADLLPCILKGLADESEFIRDTSLQAGQTLVNRFGDTGVELFLPELERGLFDNSWRIRCSSIQLLGDLLYKVSGLSGKMSTESEEDDNFGTEEARTAIIRCLGEERRNRVLAGLYMGRSDVSLMVRQAALHVWKVVVTHTVRTLREILQTLISLLLSFLGSDSSDKSKGAARTLGDLVRKLGERVLPEVIPMLERGLTSTDTKERQGVCIGLSEIIQQTSRDHVLLYMDSLLPTVRNSLCDAEEEVRAAAAQTFNSLHNTIGPRILDEVLTPLLNDLSSSSQRSEVALDGLKQVMTVKSRVVLPHIIPQLVKPPVNARALALLSSVAGEALHSHLHRIIPALISSLVGEVDQGTWEAAEGVVLSVQSEPGVATLIEELVKAAKKETPQTRAAAMGLLQVMCSRSSADITEHVPHLIIFVTESLNDPSDPVSEKAWLSLEALVKRVDQKELPHYIGYLRKALKTVSNMLIGDELRGFSLKGITPCLTMLKEGLITGSPDEKEEAARVLIEVIHLSSTKTLSTGKVVMLIAGPLIRVLGDRYGWNIKVATLEALVELVRKVGAAAKSFLPQLQTSYLKALGDVNRPVRVQAVTGLTELLPLAVRVDPVFNDLHNGIKKNDDPALRLTVLQALHGAVKVAGGRMSEKHKTEILATLLTLYSTAQESNRLQAAQCTGVLCCHLSDDQLTSVLRDTLLQADGESDWSLLQARATSLSAAVEAAAARIEAVKMERDVVNAAVKFASSDRIPVCVSGLQAVGSCINHLATDPAVVLPAFTQGLTHSSTDIRIAACDVCSCLKVSPDPLLSAVLPLLLGNTQEKNTAVRASAESSIFELVGDEAGLAHCTTLVGGQAAKPLETVFSKVKAKLAKEN